jgi:methionyl-tRNA synthetase
MLSFAYKRFDGAVPSLVRWMPRTGRCWPRSRPASRRWASCTTPASSAPLLRYLRTCLGEAIGLAREANVYTFATLPSATLRTGSACLDRKAPWFQIKEDRQGAATSVCVILRVVDNLKTILAPTLRVPHTAQKLHEYLGYEGQLRFCTGHAAGGRVPGGDASHQALTYDHSGAIGTWAVSELPPGQALREPAPLFKKLDESVIEEEYARLEG